MSADRTFPIRATRTGAGGSPNYSSGCPNRVTDANSFPPPENPCPAPYFSLESERPLYKLGVYASIIEHAVNVQQTTIYPNTSEDWLETIKMIVEPNWIDDVFTMVSLEINQDAPQSYLLDGGDLDIPLAAPLPPGCAIEISLNFILYLPNQQGIFGYTDNQMMLTNWYPFIPPYHPDRNWQTNYPADYGEHLVYPLVDFEVSLEFREKEQNITVAAPAPAVENGSITTYTLAGARVFSFAFLPNHKHLSQTIGDIVLNVYYGISRKSTAQAALDTMAKSIKTYESLFDEYPFQSLTIAEIEMDDGMEYDGIFFIGRDVFARYNQSQQNTFSLMVAHETSHNWWFSQVGNDQGIDPWLDEALATYSELLYLEDNSPELLDWWWNFRVLCYDPYGLVNVTTYDFPDYESYRQAVYLRGALFLQAVRNQIGDETFFEFLRQYYLAGEHEIATGDLFFETLEQMTSKDIDSVRRQYFGDW